MILRDAFGFEIEAGLGDYFHYKGCRLEIVCFDSEASALFGKPVLCVRLSEGILEHKGERFQIEEGQRAPLFIFETDLVATCLRAGQKSQAMREPVQHPPEFEALESAPLDKPATKSGSAKKGKTRPQEDQPTLW